jgi:predicted SnoaL-like aldol condensation-catalyzing enzyme
MVSGSTEITDLNKTESNRLLIQSFINNILIEKRLEQLNKYIKKENYTEHNPRCVNEQIELKDILSKNVSDDFSINYEKCHQLLAEGNFVLSACEGTVDKTQTSFFDLYRIENGKIIEHWDTTETIPLRSKWKNDNGKF